MTPDMIDQFARDRMRVRMAAAQAWHVRRRLQQPLRAGAGRTTLAHVAPKTSPTDYDRYGKAA